MIEKYDKIIINKNIQKIFSVLPNHVTLLAATKTVPAKIINYAYECGIRVIGENRVNELLEKFPDIDKRLKIHFIGTLQRNKVKYIIDKVDMIHSLDSINLAAEIDRQAKKVNRIMDCLIEVNIGEEKSKSGIYLEDTESFLNEINAFNNIRVCGLMAIPPKIEENEKNKEYFKKINRKFIDIRVENVDNGNIGILSLGMSLDWQEAVECGSTLIRVGEGIFGGRNQSFE